MKLQCNITELYLKVNSQEILLLNNINFQIDENKVYSIIGKNGSGKTTLIKSLSLLLDKRFYTINGNITADDISLTKMNEEQLREFRSGKIKYVFQDAMYSFDPLRKLGYYLKRFRIPDGEAEELLAYFNMPSLNNIKNIYPWQLSGGMIQRFSLIFSLLLKPEMLVLDEPTSGLDAPVSNLVLLKIKEFVSAPKRSVLIITQDMAFAEAVSDQIAHIENKTLSSFVSADEYMRSEKRLFIK